MDLDKYNKVVWAVIGGFVLLGIGLAVLGTAFGIAWSIYSSFLHRTDGIAVQAGKGEKEDDKGYILKTVYEMPLLTEGSDHYVVPVSFKKVPKSRASDRLSAEPRGVATWASRSESKWDYGGYKYFDRPCHNLIFISKKNGQAKKLLNERAYIGGIYFPEKKSFLDNKARPAFILLKIGKKDTNGDGTINDQDALAGYMVDLDGKNLTQVTPAGTNMVSWQFDADSKKLFLLVGEDTNGDNKFTEEDGEKVLAVDQDSPGPGQEIIPDAFKKEIDAVR